MGAAKSIPEPPPPPPEPIFSMANVTMGCSAIVLISLILHGSALMASAKKLSARGKRNCMLSSAGIVASVVCLFVEPAESYLSVVTANKIASVINVVFSALFLFMAEFFMADNFSVKPKDNFGLVFCRMFGLQGLWSIWLGQSLAPVQLLQYLAIFNAGIIFVGPQRGEMMLPTNEKHIVPHVGTLAVGLALLATLP